MSSANTALLKVEGLEKRFGGITALADYCVEIRQGGGWGRATLSNWHSH